MDKEQPELKAHGSVAFSLILVFFILCLIEPLPGISKLQQHIFGSSTQCYRSVRVLFLPPAAAILPLIYDRRLGTVFPAAGLQMVIFSYL